MSDEKRSVVNETQEVNPYEDYSNIQLNAGVLVGAEETDVRVDDDSDCRKP